MGPGRAADESAGRAGAGRAGAGRAGAGRAGAGRAGAARRRRRLGFLLGGTALGLVGFEVALQAVAFVVWVTAAPHGDRPGGGRTGGRAGGTAEVVVLCVGDSNTYGVGASSADRAYPALLERRLNAARADAHGTDAGAGRYRVVNGGWPGRNSREVLLALPGQLRTHRPRLVYVLVGANDAWSLPDAVADDELPRADPVAPATPPRGDDALARPGFEIRWRTGRFFALVVAWLRGRGDNSGAGASGRVGDDDPPPFVGTWHDPEHGTELRIEAGGRFLLAGHEMWWATDGDDAILLTIGAADRERLVWGIDIGRGDLWLQNDRRGRLLFAPGPPSEPARDNLLFDKPETIDSTHPEFEAAFAQACRRLVENPSEQRVWDQLAHMKLEPRHWTRIESSMRAALERELTVHARAGLLRGFSILPHTPRDDALRFLLRATCVDGLGGPTVEFLKRQRPAVPHAEYRRAVDEVIDERREGPGGAAGDAGRRDELLTLYEQSVDAARGYAAVLEGHLRQIVVQCRAAGAEAVLLDYPLRVPEIEAVVERLCDELGVGAVRLGAVFERLLRSRSRDELFVPDGHCNDAGYEIVTGLVFDDVCART